MSKHASDLWPLLNAMAGVSSTTPSVVHQIGVTNAVDDTDLSSLHIYQCSSNLGHPLLLSPIHPKILSGIDECVASLVAKGCTTSKVGPSDASDLPEEMFTGLNAFSMWAALMARDNPEPFSATIREGIRPFSGVLELLLEAVKSMYGLSNHIFPAIFVSLTEYTQNLSPSENERNCALADAVKIKLHAALGTSKVLILPCIPTPAPMHNESLLRIFDTGNLSFFNIMELPVTSVPLGLTADGLPVGIQVVAGHGQDHVCIAVAKALQQAGIAKWEAPRPVTH